MTRRDQEDSGRGTSEIPGDARDATNRRKPRLEVRRQTGGFPLITAGTQKFEQRHSKQDPMSEAVPAHRTSAVRCTTHRLYNVGPARPEDAVPRVRRLVVDKRRTTDRNKLDRTCGAGGWGFPPTCAGTPRIGQVDTQEGHGERSCTNTRPRQKRDPQGHSDTAVKEIRVLGGA